MKHRTHLISLIGLIVVGSISIPARADDTAQTGRHGTELVATGSLSDHQVSGGTARQQAEIRYGIYLYAREGLLMPQLRIYIHDSADPCHGHSGLYNADGLGDRIDICTAGIILHELAHAWEYHNVAESTRQAFVDHLGLPTWDDHQYSHGSRGVEKAAEAISWGIGSGRLDADKIEQNQTYRGWLNSYELLVGQRSPKIAHLSRPDQEGDVVAWGMQRFADAGLVLPQLDIVVHDSLAACDGRVGMYHRAVRRIDICRLDQQTVLHELSHAWAHLNMSDSDRAAFIRARSLDSWNDQGDEWSERATEHTAEIITWALLPQDTTVRWVEDGIEEHRLLTIPNSSPAQLAASYLKLTGRQVPDRRAHPSDTPADYSPEARRRSLQPKPDTAAATLPGTSTEPEVIVDGGSDQRLMVTDILERFADLALLLPAMRVRFHPAEDGCDGHKGLFDSSTDPWTLEICSDLEWVVAHEIGHAWELANLTPEDRNAYMAQRGIAEWQNVDLPTNEQGVEDIAFNIQKAILQGPAINESVAAAFALIQELTQDMALSGSRYGTAAE